MLKEKHCGPEDCYLFKASVLRGFILRHLDPGAHLCSPPALCRCSSVIRDQNHLSGLSAQRRAEVYSSKIKS